MLINCSVWIVPRCGFPIFPILLMRHFIIQSFVEQYWRYAKTHYLKMQCNVDEVKFWSPVLYKRGGAIFWVITSVMLVFLESNIFFFFRKVWRCLFINLRLVDMDAWWWSIHFWFLVVHGGSFWPSMLKKVTKNWTEIFIKFSRWGKSIRSTL